MKVVFNKENLFIPDYNDNKIQSETDQIKVYWRYLTGSEKDQLVVTKYVGENYQVQVNNEILIKNAIIRIENLSISDGSETKEVKTGAELARTRGLTELYDEIALYLMGKANKDINTKN